MQPGLEVVHHPCQPIFQSHLGLPAKLVTHLRDVRSPSGRIICCVVHEHNLSFWIDHLLYKLQDDIRRSRQTAAECQRRPLAISALRPTPCLVGCMLIVRRPASGSASRGCGVVVPVPRYYDPGLGHILTTGVLVLSVLTRGRCPTVCWADDPSFPHTQANQQC